MQMLAHQPPQLMGRCVVPMSQLLVLVVDLVVGHNLLLLRGSEAAVKDVIGVELFLGQLASYLLSSFHVAFPMSMTLSFLNTSMRCYYKSAGYLP
jgi:hypothetical protein